MVKKITAAKAVKAEVQKAIDEEPEGKERSYKARIIFSDKSFTIDIPVRWNKLTSKEIDTEYPIINRSPKGDEVRNKTWVDDKVIETGEDEKEGWLTCNPAMKTKMTKAWTTAKAEIVKDKINAFQIVDGKENPVEKNKKSEEFKVIALKDMAEYDDWQPEESGFYKLWAETPQGVWSLGQFVKTYLVDANKFAAIKISLGSSYKEYYGIIKPIIKGNSFGLTMKISRVKIDWENKNGLMEFLKDKPADEAPKTKAKVGLDSL